MQGTADHNNRVYTEHIYTDIFTLRVIQAAPAPKIIKLLVFIVLCCSTNTALMGNLHKAFIKTTLDHFYEFLFSH